MRYVQLNDIYLNIYTMLIGRSVPGADVESRSALEMMIIGLLQTDFKHVKVYKKVILCFDFPRPKIIDNITKPYQL